MEATCYLHPEVAAVANCHRCGRPACAECIVRAEGTIFCSRTCADASRAIGQETRRRMEAARRASPAAWLLRVLLLGAIAVAILEWLRIVDLTPWP